ncbi:MAG: PAS domain S-box protein [candidate division WOR-3 bacterium]|nr:MAG: PAS domain S-box protein [candidate division WOR-3 bacterium]
MNKDNKKRESVGSNLKTILVIDDNPDDRALTVRALSLDFPNVQIKQIRSIDAFESALKQGGFDLVITDYKVHWIDGLEVLRRVKEANYDCPVIMFTGTGNEEIAVDAMKAGLDDYVIKSPKHFVRLPAAVHSVMDRRIQRKAKEKAEARYRTLFEDVPVGLYSASTEGKILEANPVMVQMFGYPDRESLTQVNLSDLHFNPEDRTRWLNAIMQDGFVRNFEAPMRRRDGSVFWVNENARAVIDPGGKATYFQGSMEDISERKYADEALRESKERYRLLYEYAGNAIFTYDLNFKLIDVNKIACDFTGKRREDLIGRNFLDLDIISKDDTAKIKKDNEQLVGGAKSQVVVSKVHFKHTDGRYSIVEVTGTAIYREGKIVAITNVCRDVTERERLLVALEESEEKYRTLVEHSSDGIFIYGDDRFMFVNDQLSKITHYEKEELYDISPWKIIYPNDRDKVKEIDLRRRMGEEVPRAYDVRIVTKHGDIRYCEFAVTKIVYQGDEANLVSVRNITDRKQMEDELHQSLVKLEKTIQNTLQAMAKIQEARDPYTTGHQLRVAALAQEIAKEMYLPEEWIRGIQVAALIHDIGKIYVPAEILSRPSQLTTSEFALVKTHPSVGYDILKTIEFPWPIADVVLQHHERLDGSGYPRGLKTGGIMLESQILAVADVVEAMSSHRPYRPAHTLDYTLEEISTNKGRLYEPDVVDSCLWLITGKGFKFN